MDEKQFVKTAQRFLDVWNTQDVDKVLASYTEELVYIDPNTHGEINAQQAMRQYITKLFSIWSMHWSLRSVYVFKDTNGAAVRWHASIKRAGGGETVEIDGVDLVILDGDRVKRNEVYFDRAALSPLMAR